MAYVAIATRAHAGMIRTRADRFIFGVKSSENFEIPAEFWWAKGHEALTQNWEIGDFETYLDHKIRLQAFGVRFHRDGLKQMVPSAFTPDVAADLKSEGRNLGGRRMSALWPEWVAELVMQVHESGIPSGSGSQGTDELIAKVADRLAARGQEAPSRTTVQDTVMAVLRRLRAG
jgi:hypothetical protein